MILLLYDTGTHAASLNMAVDDVLLKKTEPVLRLYQWEGTAITLGRFQGYREVDVAAALRAGIPVVRRETGGKAVLHGDDLTISLMLEKNQPFVSIRETIKLVGEGIVKGLHILGIKAGQVSPGEKYHPSASCFSVNSPYEVVVGRKKIAGIAGRLYKSRILFQVSIPFSLNMENLNRYFFSGQTKSMKPFYGIGLKDVLHLDWEPESIKRAFISGLKESLDADTKDMTLTKAELEQAEDVAAGKYNRNEWNLAY